MLLGVAIAFAALIVTVAVWRCTGSRRTGGPIPGALGDAITAVLPPPVARLLAREAAQGAAVIRWIARRPLGVPEGAHPVGYGRDQVALVSTFVALTAGEVAAVELLVPWPALRIMLLVLGGYGLLIMTGFVAINRTRPHVLDHHQVRLRCGLFADITLSPTDIAAVALARQPTRDHRRGTHHGRRKPNPAGDTADRTPHRVSGPSRRHHRTHPHFRRPPSRRGPIAPGDTRSTPDHLTSVTEPGTGTQQGPACDP